MREIIFNFEFPLVKNSFSEIYLKFLVIFDQIKIENE